MEQKKFEETKIVIGRDKIITREKLFEDKANFHKEQACLPFEEKIKILVKLQEIASKVKGPARPDKSGGSGGRDIIIWEIQYDEH